MVARLTDGTPEPVAYITRWEASFKPQTIDVTSTDDDNPVYVGGIGSGSGNFDGWYDDETAWLYTAAMDGLPRRFYLYPSLVDSNIYWYGRALFEFRVRGGVGEIISVNGAWAAMELFLASSADGPQRWSELTGHWSELAGRWSEL